MKEKLMVWFNRAVIYLYAFALGIISKLYPFRKCKNHKVHIFFPQQIGDIILFSNALRLIAEKAVCTSSEPAVIFVRKEVADFMDIALPLPKTLRVITLDMELLTKDFFYFRKVKETYFRNIYSLIIPNTSIMGELVGAAASAERKIAMCSSIRRVRPLYMRPFYHFAYTDLIVADKDEMELKRYCYLMQHLGINRYEASMPVVKSFPQKYAGPYFVICPGSSLREKIWPVERFVQITNALLKQIDGKVYICGNSIDSQYGEFITEHSLVPERIKDLTGKTKITDWISLLRYADFVIGNDSASIHIAAALGTQAFCITGEFDKNQFFPYQVDRHPVNRPMPIMIRKTQKCAYCRIKGNYAGYHNPACKKNILENGTALCIEEIQVGDVLKVVSAKEFE